MAENLTFLTLVPEIRDQIYELVLSSPIPPPKSPSACSRRRKRAKIYPSGFGEIIEETTYYPLQPFPWPGAALVRTCRQVYAEVSALSRVLENRNRAKDRGRYELDIMINEELALYPTWLNLPFEKPTEQQAVDQIWADLRTMGVSDPPKSSSKISGWRTYSARPPPLVWGLFNMLSLFFEYGPSFQEVCLSNRMGHPREPHTGIKVPRLEELVINVVTPTEEEMEGRSYADRWALISVGVLRPEELVECLTPYFKCLHDWASDAGGSAKPYGFPEKLGKIRLCLDRKEVQSWRFSPPPGLEQVLHPATAI